MGATSQTNLYEGESKTSRLRMIILGFVLVTPTFLYGLNLSYPTVALPQMNLSISEASWFASVSIYAASLSLIIVGLIIDKFGRKTALLFSLAPSIVGWSLLLWNRNIYMVLLGQMFNGLTMGAGFYPVQVYAGECIMVDNVRMRNVFMTWISVSSSLGSTCMLLMANLFNYTQICAISTTLCAFLLVVFWLAIPESPSWLYRQGRIGDAEWSQKKLGIVQPILRTKFSGSCDSSGDSGECANLSPNTRADQAQQKRLCSRSTIVKQLRILTRPDVYKPILILGFSSVLLSFCGTVTVVSYMINIIDNTIPGVDVPSSQLDSKDVGAAAGLPLVVLTKSYQYSLISGICMCIGSFVSIFLLPVMGMKKMFITSKLFIIAGLVTLTYSTVVHAESNASTRAAGVSLLSFLMGLELGPRQAFAGDVFPVDAKGFASIPSLTGSIATATANKIFPYLRVVFGGYAYLFYAGASLLGVFYIHFFLPEVVGRTLDEINKAFKKDED